MAGLNFLLRCNYDEKCLDQSGMPSFYKQILLFFRDLRVFFNQDTGQDMILFNNKDILIDGKTVCYNKWLERNVIAVHGLPDQSTGKFLSYHEFKQNYNLNCNFLTFFQVILAIPSIFLKKAKSSKHLDKGNCDRNNVIFHLSPSISSNLLKVQSRDYRLLNRGDTKATGLIKCGKELHLVDFKWDNYFNSIKTLCNGTKLRDFYYKLLHRIVTTKRELFFYYGIASDQTCYLCSMPDSIEHTFVDCPISNQLYNKIIKWFNEDNASSFYPSSLEILFGNFECSRGPKVRKLNYTLLFSKYYIYCQKLNNKELHFNEFKQRCLFRYKGEGLNE